MKTAIACAAAFGAALALAPAIAKTPLYQVVGSVVGPDGGWDYARVDPSVHRLYVARGNSITVVDTKARHALGSLGTIAHGHAVLPLSGGRLLVTSGDDATVRFLDADSGAEVGRVSVGKKPDAAILSTDGRRAFVMNATAGTVSVIDVGAMRVVGTLTSKPGLEYAALAADGTLFVNNEDANEIEVLDSVTGRAADPVALPGCEAPSGLALDAPSGRLVSACANGKAAIVDVRHRKLVGLVDIGRGPDAVMIDTGRRLAFVPCGGDGVLDVLSLSGPVVRRVARVKTEQGARTGALDASTGTIYLPTARFGPPTKPGGRGSPSAGTFRVLIVSPVGQGKA